MLFSTIISTIDSLKSLWGSNDDLTIAKLSDKLLLLELELELLDEVLLLPWAWIFLFAILGEFIFILSLTPGELTEYFLRGLTLCSLLKILSSLTTLTDNEPWACESSNLTELLLYFVGSLESFLSSSNLEGLVIIGGSSRSDKLSNPSSLPRFLSTEAILSTSTTLISFALSELILLQRQELDQATMLSNDSVTRTWSDLWQFSWTRSGSGELSSVEEEE